MSVYSSIKGVWDKATFPLALGGWLFLPFFGSSANAATAINPDANMLDVAQAFYGPVLADPMAAVTTGLGKFASIAAADTTALGGHVLSAVGVSSISSVFAFATGAAVVGAGFYAAYKISSAIFAPKAAPAPAAA